MTKMSASEAFVETLVANEVKYVFGIVGSAFMDALDIFEPAGIRFVSVAHEQGAAHMADGYSRASGRHGVCIAQNGPGITNFVTAIAAAYWAHSPVVFITPETGTNTMGLGGFQETEQIPIFSKITKYQADIRSSERIAELSGRAFDIAMAERGPTQINIPRDLFYGEYDYSISKPTRIELSAGGAQGLEDAAECLAEAKFPVILAGGGVVMGKADKHLLSLAEKLKIPVCNTYLHNDSFPADHDLWLGPIGYQGSKAAMKILAQADCVLALGTRIGPFGTLPQHSIDYWPKNARIIQIDRNSRAIGLVKKIDIGIVGDAGLAAEAIEKILAQKKIACLDNVKQRMKIITQEKQKWEEELNQWGQNDSSPISPRRALRELEKAMPKNAMVTTDIGNICSIANSYLRFNTPNSFFAAMSFGNCGYAFPTVIGCKFAEPTRPAIAYVGDGAWGISLNEMLTCVREDIPVIVVLFNNEQWGAEKKNQVDFYEDRFVGTNLNNPSWKEVAQSFGMHAVKVSKADQIADALKKALATKKPYLIEIMVTKELGAPFRRDALKKPVRLLDKYKKYSSK